MGSFLRYATAVSACFCVRAWSWSAFENNAVHSNKRRKTVFFIQIVLSLKEFISKDYAFRYTKNNNSFP
jgi:hypothetical protein